MPSSFTSGKLLKIFILSFVNCTLDYRMPNSEHGMLSAGTPSRYPGGRISDQKICGEFCWIIAAYYLLLIDSFFVLAELKKGRNQSLGLPTIVLIPSPSCFHRAHSSLCACLVKTPIRPAFQFPCFAISQSPLRYQALSKINEAYFFYIALVLLKSS